MHLSKQGSVRNRLNVDFCSCAASKEESVTGEESQLYYILSFFFLIFTEAVCM